MSKAPPRDVSSIRKITEETLKIITRIRDGCNRDIRKLRKELKGKFSDEVQRESKDGVLLSEVRGREDQDSGSRREHQSSEHGYLG